MRYFITGGLGFLAQNLIKELSKDKDNEIVIFDNKHRCNPKLKNNYNITTHCFDVRDIGALQYCMKDCDVVFHLSAQSNVVGAESYHKYTFTTNVDGTWNVLNVAKAMGVKKVVFTSSREVYGDPFIFPVAETSVLHGKNLYGKTKVIGEEICDYFSKDMEVNILRLANVYGSGDFGRVIPNFIDKLKENEPLEVHGGNQIIDFVHVDTIVEALIKASEMPQFSMPINIGSGKGTTVLELANKMCVLSGKENNIKLFPAREYEVKGYVADITRMKNILGIIPPEDPLWGLPELMKESGL